MASRRFVITWWDVCTRALRFPSFSVCTFHTCFPNGLCKMSMQDKFGGKRSWIFSFFLLSSWWLCALTRTHGTLPLAPAHHGTLSLISPCFQFLSLWMLQTKLSQVLHTTFRYCDNSMEQTRHFWSGEAIAVSLPSSTTPLLLCIDGDSKWVFPLFEAGLGWQSCLSLVLS